MYKLITDGDGVLLVSFNLYVNKNSVNLGKSSEHDDGKLG